ncbi:MAG: glycerol-3-phosphate 1-O-acyltransferase PlsY [Candidatus Omnitrophica bacterium]|nr:glycerol-3-phosphate 1-O-acyltransferase PlsY [Candidatus Omnitrophota bacterium]
MLWIIPAIVTSYLIGSIPTAYVFGRVFKGVDIRKFGSGNVGATNAMRLLGRGLGITVLVLDIFKGLLAVVFLGDFLVKQSNLIQEQNLRIIIGLCCICGHNWTVFLNFKGGKGVATTFGVLIGLGMRISGLNIVLGFLILTWFLFFLILRFVSVASVISGLSLPIYMFLFRQSKVLILVSILLALFVILRHKSNLKRFFQGKEPRLSFKKT